MITMVRSELTDELKAFLGGLPDGDAHICMTATDGGLLAAGLLTLRRGKTYLSALVCAQGMESLAHGLGKALLNLADLQGIGTVYGDTPALVKVYQMLGFREEAGEWKLSLAGYFTAQHDC